MQGGGGGGGEGQSGRGEGSNHYQQRHDTITTMTAWGLLVAGLDVQGPSNSTVHTLGGAHIYLLSIYYIGTWTLWGQRFRESGG